MLILFLPMKHLRIRNSIQGESLAPDSLLTCFSAVEVLMRVGDLWWLAGLEDVGSADELR